MDRSELIPVKVVPRARRSEVVGRQSDGCWRVRVAAVPEDGQANEELCRLLAQTWGLPRRAIEIVAGRTSTRKLVRVTHGPDWTVPEPPPVEAR